MKVFEFHFNPDKKDGVLFDSFCYDPENSDERKLGNLYAVGELKNALPQNYKLINQLATQIKKEYYLSSLRSPEKSLTEGLKKGNEFLEGLTKKGDVSWLGNLNFAVMSVKDSVFHFTKAEKMFAFLLRAGKIVNISQRLVQEEINPYPIKFFGNFISGKLNLDDVMIIMTKEVANFFISENILNEVASLSVFTDKKLKEILSLRNDALKTISGVAVLVAVTEGKEKITKNAQPQVLKFDRTKEKFSLSEALSPITKLFKIILQAFIKLLRKIPLPGFNFNIGKFKLSRPKINRFRASSQSGRNLLIIFAFVLILALGFYLFQLQEQRESEKINKILETIQNKNIEAQNLFNTGSKNEANALFSGAWNELNNLEKTGVSNQKSQEIKKDLESYLLKLSNFNIIDDPAVVFDFTGTKAEDGAVFVPQKIAKIGEIIYLFNPAIQNIFELNINTKSGELVKKEQKFSFGFPLNSNSLMFFAKPDNLVDFRLPDQYQNSKIQFPQGDFDFIDFKINLSNLYFLDKKQSLILKCPYSYGAEKQICQFWLSKDAAKKPENAVSFAADGNLWILNEDGKIDRYRAGLYQETLKMNLFPLFDKPTKIYTIPGLPYLYILEPIKNRVLVFTKSGEIVKQFQSKKFDNIKDIAVSNNGKTIYLLSGTVLYKIGF